MSIPPPPHVQSAFGCRRPPFPLAGGQGEAYQCGDIVLKPCRDAVEASWIAEVHLDIDRTEFRVPQPVRATTGEWVVDGWLAWTFIEGSHRHDRWGATIAACRAFHHALSGIPKPAFIDGRDDPFARADRIAWGEADADCHPRIQAVLERLIALREPVDLPSQVIHGDVTENVLFAPNLPPAVIDFSPYWRPAVYAQAIVMADALDWCGADASTITWVDDIPDIWQLMVRAEIFRIVLHGGFSNGDRPNLDAVARHLNTVDLLERKLG